MSTWFNQHKEWVISAILVIVIVAIVVIFYPDAIQTVIKANLILGLLEGSIAFGRVLLAFVIFMLIIGGMLSICFCLLLGISELFVKDKFGITLGWWFAWLLGSILFILFGDLMSRMLY